MREIEPNLHSYSGGRLAKYDAVLKLLLQQSPTLLRDVISEPIAIWHNTDLHRISSQYADVLAETGSGKLWHIELQAQNNPDMPARMLEYSLRVFCTFRKWPKQTVLYVGRSPLRMKRELVGEDLHFRYRIVDAKDLDGEALLASPSANDNVMAILARLRSSRESVRRILTAIAALQPSPRDVAFEALILLSGLRKLESTVEKEARDMRVFDDILDNKVLGREYKRGLAQGREQGREQGLREGRGEGREEGRVEGRHAGALDLLRVVLQARFGEIPPPLGDRLPRMTAPELENLAQRAVTASSLDDLLR